MSGPLPSRLRIGPDSRRFGNNSQWTRTLDQNYAIDAISSAALNLDATLDDVGNFTGLITSGQSYQFGYDPLYRLSELRQGSSVLEHFDYDATGNRTAATLGGSAQSYAYPTNSHRLQSINGVSRDYDNVGNTTQRDGLTYTYNGRNRLSRVSMGRTTYYSNTYNARGEREEKSLTNGLTVQRFIYDEAGRLIQTGNVPPIGLTRTLKPEQRLLWLDDQLVGVKMMKVESNAYAGELLYAHTDHLGTPRALSRPSANNSIVWRWPLETTAFGQHPAQPDPDGDGQALTFNLRYPGQYFDSESGLHYNYFRDYEAGVGRYIESDPINLLGGINTYVYVGSRPLLFVDPLGLSPNGWGCMVGGTIGMVGGAALCSPSGPGALACSAAGGALVGAALGCATGSLIPEPEPLVTPQPMPFAPADTGEVCPEEKPDCRKVKQDCLAKCSDEALPSGDNGFRFWNCLNKCMKDNRCEGQ